MVVGNGSGEVKGTAGSISSGVGLGCACAAFRATNAICLPSADQITES